VRSRTIAGLKIQEKKTQSLPSIGVLSCAKIAGAIDAVFGWWMGPMFFLTMLDSALGGDRSNPILRS